MTSVPSLDELRAAIDRIDDAMLDLIADRVEITRAVGMRKRLDNAPMLRPGREAQLLRRLAAKGALRGTEPGVIVRIWRELFALSFTGLQTRLTLVVGSNDRRIWDLARDHFGAAFPMRRCPAAADALAVLASGEVDLAVLPWPGETGDGLWWRDLASSDDGEIGVFVALPFLAEPGAAPVMALGRHVAEPSGDDLTLVAIHDAHAPDGAAGLAIAWSLDADDGRWRLAALEGFIAADDPRLARLGGRVRRIGAYARPIDPGR
ncbi:chorismate mutase [Marinivivus vitaminiproducens]|uniref:chorismate mutase n=1 Tax=Marinivivus vitaminiproducens TaxID=3035935 RepID=UPI00279E3CBE|nr:chorismate mutase [Geminicoccaceae bacterium SCSIO 64248]